MEEIKLNIKNNSIRERITNFLSEFNPDEVEITEEKVNIERCRSFIF
jgi:hypothetical protein